MRDFTIDENQAKSIYIVLSRSKSIASSAIFAFTRDAYTHAALALDKELKYMFSFGRRNPRNPFVGCFKHERFDDAFYNRHSALPGMVLEISVSPEQHRGIVAEVLDFVHNEHVYRYNYRGLLTTTFKHEGASREHKFFCSEFVYHILHKNGVCDLAIPRTIVRPLHFLEINATKIFEGNLFEYKRDYLNQVSNTLCAMSKNPALSTASSATNAVRPISTPS